MITRLAEKSNWKDKAQRQRGRSRIIFNPGSSVKDFFVSYSQLQSNSLRLEYITLIEKKSVQV